MKELTHFYGRLARLVLPAMFPTDPAPRRVRRKRRPGRLPPGHAAEADMLRRLRQHRRGPRPRALPAATRPTLPPPPPRPTGRPELSALGPSPNDGQSPLRPFAHPVCQTVQRPLSGQPMMGPEQTAGPWRLQRLRSHPLLDGSPLSPASKGSGHERHQNHTINTVRLPSLHLLARAGNPSGCSGGSQRRGGVPGLCGSTSDPQ